ncbi:hypothetical protein BG015_010231 [Linnemannia schmuckeri]|uniref:Uncharacterized protein n=1 Tax=Linnemannia schmuckeri TaxID=64567 RepID=A0A9P5RUU8_9FUNG|nr:hypothetical protein BG015_010231 [Linnemannia schmuckeri]
MGPNRVYLDCIATDPASSTLYAITSGKLASDSASSSSYKINNKIFLLKSTTPTTPLPYVNSHNNITWSVISTTPSAPLSYGHQAFRTVDCAVSSKGAFTALFRNAQALTPGTDLRELVPVGVRYDPKTDGWVGVRTSVLYGWTSSLWQHQSFYVSKDGGEEVLVHMLTDVVGSVVRFGVVDGVDNVLRLASVWKLADKDKNQYHLGSIYDTMSWETLHWTDLFTNGLFKTKKRYDSTKIVYANGRLYMTRYRIYTMTQENTTTKAMKLSTLSTVRLSNPQDKKTFPHSYYETVHQTFIALNGYQPYPQSQALTPIIIVVGLTAQGIYGFSSNPNLTNTVNNSNTVPVPIGFTDLRLPEVYFTPGTYD